MALKRKPGLRDGFTKIGNPHAGGAYFLIRGGDREASIRLGYELQKTFFVHEFRRQPEFTEQILLWAEAKARQEALEADLRAEGVPPRFARLIGSRKKKEQCRLLEEPMTPAEFHAAVFNIATVGYTHDAVSYEFVPEELESTPAEHDAFWSAREHPDAKRYMRKISATFKQRTLSTVHMFREVGGDYWHSIYFTQRDMLGEHWDTSHVHYQSRAYAPMSAADFLAQFGDGEWHSQGPHVKWLDEQREATRSHFQSTR